jgi:hypothetical protein
MRYFTTRSTKPVVKNMGRWLSQIAQLRESPILSIDFKSNSIEMIALLHVQA